ncbi:hypothetical protein SteCoe_14235 [Stentor coeruleus]|uniref:Uncharacterized protein n=1 Tax=Stentor coeruleus TaxID=5963 RepID=A0A1R2C6M6_9CILI|nr:hypothetical protein SteCoe_14235 [Stentor coeruleus]
MHLSSELKESTMKCLSPSRESQISNLKGFSGLEKQNDMHSDTSPKGCDSANSLIFEESGGEIGEGKGLHYGNFHESFHEGICIEDLLYKNYVFYN